MSDGPGTPASFAPDSALVDAVTPSPNGEPRRGCDEPDLLLLHYTGMPDADAALAWLRTPASKVSCHYFVFESGRIVQLVPEAMRAWHAGLSIWEDETDVNSRTIGVEIANPGHDGGCPPFPDAQIDAVIALARDVCTRHAIAPARVLAHSDVAPARKQDPGERFPWQRLAEAGIGHWVAPVTDGEGHSFFEGDAGEPVEEIQTLLALYGYGIEISGRYDAATQQVVTAFQRHFRPARVDGVADPGTVETLRRLLRSLPDR